MSLAAVGGSLHGRTRSDLNKPHEAAARFDFVIGNEWKINRLHGINCRFCELLLQPVQVGQSWYALATDL